MACTLDISNHATGPLARFAEALRGRNVNPVIGRAAALAVRKHLDILEAQRPNTQGWPRQHFWAALSRSVHHAAQPDGVRVAIAHVGAALRYYGGTILPVRAKALTIPACAAAYGKSARSFNNLRLVKMNGKLALVEAERNDIRISRKTGKVKRLGEKGGKVMFWLVPKAVQKPDPSVLPLPDVMVGAITTAVEDYVDALRAQRPSV